VEIDCDALDSFYDRRSFHHVIVDVEQDTQEIHKTEVVARMVVVPRGETCDEETCHTAESRLVEGSYLGVVVDMIAVAEQLHKVAVVVHHHIHHLVAQNEEDNEHFQYRTALQTVANAHLAAVAFPLAAFQIAVDLVNEMKPRIYQAFFLMTCRVLFRFYVPRSVTEMCNNVEV
jgi:hypothetical protein